jgi:hypothetical protein
MAYIEHQRGRREMKYETVCIRRHGLDMLHSEDADFAAKVTYLCYDETFQGIYDPRHGVKQELLIPVYGKWE